MSSPAERYAAARLRATAARTSLAGFAADLPFELDPFQVQACTALEGGRGVLVAAPTGAGKTVVGEFAIHLALSKGQKAFYTTPIKALSNQKYADLARRHGAEQVGLLTGDTTLNGDAPVVVMTTEVLRNMLYAGSSTLKGLAYVVMDEVHYLADRFRGPVWEEVIIHLPADVALVSLSATVSNAEEFGDWLTMVRGDTAVVVSEIFGVHARHGLVQQEKRRLHGEGPSQLDPLLKAVRERTDRLRSHRLDLEKVDDLLDKFPVLDLLSEGRPDEHKRPPEAMAHVHMTSKHQVLEHRHVLKQFDVLEGTCDAPAGGRARSCLG